MMLKLTSEDKNQLIKEIQNYFLEERDEELGVIAAESVLEFFMEEIGKVIYNKALDDARVWLARKAEDIENDFDMLYK